MREVSQIYSLSATERDLCKGPVGVTVQGMLYFLSADLFGEENGADYSQAIAEFRNSAGTIISSHSMSSETGRPAVWPENITAGQAPSYRFATGWMPANTHSVRIRVRAVLASGNFNNGYVDNVRFELRPSNFIKPLGASGDLVKIEPGQIESQNSAPFVQVAAGGYHSLALKGDGTVVAWGDNGYGQSSVPSGLFGVTAIAAGNSGSAAKLANGRWITWGQAPATTDDPWWARSVLAISSGPFGISHVIRGTQSQSPHRLFLAKGAVWENRSGAVQDTLWPDDPNRGDTHTYQLVSGDGDADNGLFTLTGQTLTLTTPVDYEQKTSYRLRARVTDSTGLSHEQALVLAVVDDDLEDADNDGLTQRQETARGTSDANPDMDNDGYLDGVDALPFDPTEWLDTDGDGIGNNADPDDDNDGIADAADLTTEGTNPARLDLGFGTLGRVRFSFGSNGDLGHAVALQADGRIVMAGAFSNGGSNLDFAVARFLANGAPDTSFSSDGKVVTPIGLSYDFCQCVAVQPDGKIVVAGHSFNGSNLDMAVVRYTAAGVLDTTFSGDGIFTLDIGGMENRVNEIHILSDGKILLAGDTGENGSGQFTLLRLSTTGVPDTTFGGGTGRVLTSFGEGYVAGWAMAVQEDGRIVLAGESNGDFALARYLANGSLDVSFNGTGKLVTDVSGSVSGDHVRDVAIQRDGKIVVAGYTQSGNSLDVAVARYTPGGQLDSSFSGDGIVVTDIAGHNDSASGVAIHNDKIWIAGRTGSSSEGDFLLMRLTASGALDPAFNGNGISITKVGNEEDHPLAMSVQPDGKVVSAGFSKNGEDYDFALVRYMGEPPVSDIVVERSNGESLIDDSSLLDAGTIAVGSNRSFSLNIRNVGAAPLTSLNFSIEGPGAAHFSVVPISSTASIPNKGLASFQVTFAPTAAGFHGAVLKIASNDPDEGIFEIHMSGSVASGTPAIVGSYSFFEYPKFQDDFWTMAIQSDQRIVVAGPGRFVGEVVVARYLPDGALDSSFDFDGLLFLPAMEEANAIAVQADGKILIAGLKSGNFAVARVTASGVMDSSFGGGTVFTDFVGGSDGITGMALQPYGKIVVGGWATVLGIEHFAAARYLSNGMLDSSFGSGGKVSHLTYGMAKGVAVDGSGRIILVGGAVMLCYLQNGVLDPSFGAAGKLVTRDNPEVFYYEENTGFDASCVVVQPDGRVLVGGSQSVPSNFLSWLAPIYCLQVNRYLPDGRLDSSFNDTGMATTLGVTEYYDVGTCMALQPDGRILIGGHSYGQYSLARFTPEGLLDSTFKGGYHRFYVYPFMPINYIIAARSVAVAANGDILMAGTVVIRLEQTGEPNRPPRAVAGGPYRIAMGEDLVLDATQSSDPDTALQAGIASYSWAGVSAGGPRPRLPWSGLNQLGINSPGSYRITLRVTDGYGYSDTADALLLVTTAAPESGAFDPTFGIGGKTEVYSEVSYPNSYVSWTPDERANAVAIQPDGKIVVAGKSGNDFSVNDFSVMRFLPNGILDSSFSSDGKLRSRLPDSSSSNYANAVAIQPDGKILAAGTNGSNFLISRYMPDGILDTSFGGGALFADFGGQDVCYGMILQDDGKIILVGTSSLAQSRFALARFLPNGELDASFGNGGKVTTLFNDGSYCYDVALQEDGKIVLVGMVGVTNSSVGLARYLPDGSLDPSFGVAGKVTTAGGFGKAVAIQPDGKIVVGGEYGVETPWGTQVQSVLAIRYLPDGSLDPSFSSGGMANLVFETGGVPDWRRCSDIALLEDGRILLVGNYISDFALIRLTTEGELDTSFGDTGSITYDMGSHEEYCNAIALQADGRIVLAGSIPSGWGNGGHKVTLARVEGDMITPLGRFADALVDAGLNGANAEAKAIPFADGVSNLIKYAFNMNLAGPDSSRLAHGTGQSGLPSFQTKDIGGGKALEIQYLRRKNSGLIYTLKSSVSLERESFAPVNQPAVVHPINESWERVSVALPINASSQPRLFTFVEVRLPE